MGTAVRGESVEQMIAEATGASPVDPAAALAAVDAGRAALLEADPQPAPAVAVPSTPIGNDGRVTPWEGKPALLEADPPARRHKRKHVRTGRGPGRPRNDARPGLEGAVPLRPAPDLPAAPELRATKAELAARLEAAHGEAARLERLVKESQQRGDVARLESLGGILAMCFDGVFRFLGQYRGAHWRLEAPESEQLGKVWAPVLAPHAAIIEEHGPLVVAAGTTLMLLRIRLAEDSRLEQLAPAVVE